MTRTIKGPGRAYVWVSAAGDLANAASRALLYAYAGTLRHAEPNAMTAQAWRAFNVDDHNPLAGFMAWERELYSKYVNPGDRI